MWTSGYEICNAVGLPIMVGIIKISKISVVVHACHPSVQEAGAGGLLDVHGQPEIHGRPVLHSNFRSAVETKIKKISKSKSVIIFISEAKTT